MHETLLSRLGKGDGGAYIPFRSSEAVAIEAIQPFPRILLQLSPHFGCSMYIAWEEGSFLIAENLKRRIRNDAWKKA